MKTNKPHSPAPWHHLGQGVIVDADNNLVAVMQGDPNVAAADIETSQQMANVRLVVGAPELLAALEELVAHDELVWGQLSELEASYENVMSIARAAIAKARGMV